MEPVVPVDLFDISKHLIVKKDSVVNFKLVHHLMEHGRRLKKTMVPFGETKLFKDFKNIFNEEKYFTVFTPYRINDEIINLARHAELTKEIFEELCNIKEHLPYTFRHMLLVTALVVKLSIDMKDHGYDAGSAVLIGLMHDLGKSHISKEILGKDTPLTKSEFSILKAHTVLGYLLLCYYLGGSFNKVLDGARDHHEALDMTGYPRGVGKIGKYTRLITPIDIFDALISERPYRGSSFTIRQALDYLIDQANIGRLDKEVVYHLISYVRKEHPHPGELLLYEKGTKLSRSDTAYGKIIPDA